MGTKIEWTDETWNVVTGCSKVSDGCKNCYAERLSHRFGWTEKPWTVANVSENVKIHPERLDQPLRWRKPRRIFVNSMSDLFHEAVPFDFIDQVVAVMALSPQHTFQILTKRPERMMEYISVRKENVEESIAFNDINVSPLIIKEIGGEWVHPQIDDYGRIELEGYFDKIKITWPLPNVWLGVSVENQKAADERIPLLLQTPAVVRFLSCEPLLGPVTIRNVFMQKLDWGDDPKEWPDGAGVIDWIIVGGESGPGARPMHPDWVRGIRDQCQAAGVAFFFKQWGEWVPSDQYPPELNGIRLSRYKRHTFEDVHQHMFHVGKKAAGRTLDGRTWDEIPIVY